MSLETSLALIEISKSLCFVRGGKLDSEWLFVYMDLEVKLIAESLGLSNEMTPEPFMVVGTNVLPLLRFSISHGNQVFCFQIWFGFLYIIQSSLPLIAGSSVSGQSSSTMVIVIYGYSTFWHEPRLAVWLLLILFLYDR